MTHGKVVRHFLEIFAVLGMFAIITAYVFNKKESSPYRIPVPVAIAHDTSPEPWFITRAQELSYNMIFFQQPGTNFCFAISYVSDSTYMAMPMATVPCESVPKDKLLTFNSH